MNERLNCNNGGNLQLRRIQNNKYSRYLASVPGTEDGDIDAGNRYVHCVVVEEKKLE